MSHSLITGTIFIPSWATSGPNITGDTTINSNTITNVVDINNLVEGLIISGTDIPSGSVITSINVGANSFEIDNLATGTNTGITITTTTSDGVFYCQNATYSEVNGLTTTNDVVEGFKIVSNAVDANAFIQLTGIFNLFKIVKVTERPSSATISFFAQFAEDGTYSSLQRIPLDAAYNAISEVSNSKFLQWAVPASVYATLQAGSAEAQYNLDTEHYTDDFPVIKYGTSGIAGASYIEFTGTGINGISSSTAPDGYKIVTINISGGSGTGGVAGTSGSSGESGTSGSSGLSFNWLGVWDGTVGGGSNISYGLNDVVYYNGTTYIFTNTTPSGIGSAEPGTNPDWDVMAISGANGTSGSSGETGASGTSGSSGESGTSGSSGESGTSGSSGESGTSGSSGETGTSGSSGESGATGTSGSSGENGTSGSSGEAGTSGSSGFSGASVTGATLTNTILELQNSDNTTVQVEFDPSTASQSKEGVTTHGFLFLDETAFTGDTFNNVFTTSAITDNIQVYYLDNSQLTAKLTYVVLDIGNFTTVSQNKVLVLPQLTGSFESKVIKFIMKRNELDDNRDVMIGSKWISGGNSDRIIAANINTKLTNSGYFFPIEPLESVEILYDGYDWLVVNTQKQQYVQATPVNYLLYGTNGTAGSFKNRDINNLL